MSKTVPIFRTHEETYQADACGPLRRAHSAGEVSLHALVHGHYPGSPLPAGSLPKLKAVGFWDADHDQAWGLPWHRNEGIEVTYVETGRLGFAVDGESFELHPGDITITRPWQRHRVGDPQVAAGRLHWLILDLSVRRPNQEWKWPSWVVLSPADRAELTNLLRHNEHPVWRGSAGIRTCFQNIARAVESDRGGDHVSLVAVRINELLLLLLDTLRKEQVALDESLASTLRTVELFLTDLHDYQEHLALPWTVGEMAKSCGLGATKFTEHTKRLTNLTPAKYLIRCRLEAAARMLSQTPAPSVTDVALECGFSSSQYFATAFRAHFGHPPTVHRNTSGGAV